MTSFNYEELKNNIQTIVENEDQSINRLEEVIRLLNADKSLDADIKSCIDHSFKNILLNYSRNNIEVKKFENLIKLSITATRRDLCTGNLPIILLTDLFEYHTTSECEKLFDLVENLIDIWKEELFFKNVKNQLLRTCNDLLRRLSRSQNTVFCGRILVFLANFFPFFERSGLNLISEFNNDESMQVVFDEEATESKNMNNGIDSCSQVEDEDGIILSNENIVLDFDLYKKFWALQEYFRMPVLCYKPLHWKKFTDCANETVELFSTYKIDNTACNIHALDSLEGNYFPKYLTSQKLLELQLCDPNFRRNILIQFLILFQYLIGKVKFKTEQQILNEEQLKWVKDMTDRILDLIAKTPVNGEQVKHAISHILTREVFWSNWKNEACVELKRCNEPAKKKFRSTSKKINLGERIRKAEQSNEIVIGSEKLTKIWKSNQEENANCNKDRMFVPMIEDYFEDILELDRTDENYEECRGFYTSDRDTGPLYCWRALRLLSKQSLNFFTPSNNPVKSVKDYIHNMIDKLHDDRASNRTSQDENKSKTNEKLITVNSSYSNNSEEVVYNLE